MNFEKQIQHFTEPASPAEFTPEANIRDMIVFALAKSWEGAKPRDHVLDGVNIQQLYYTIKDFPEYNEAIAQSASEHQWSVDAAINTEIKLITDALCQQFTPQEAEVFERHVQEFVDKLNYPKSGLCATICKEMCHDHLNRISTSISEQVLGLNHFQEGMVRFNIEQVVAQISSSIPSDLTLTSACAIGTFIQDARENQLPQYIEEVAPSIAPQSAHLSALTRLMISANASEMPGLSFSSTNPQIREFKSSLMDIARTIIASQAHTFDSLTPFREDTMTMSAFVGGENNLVYYLQSSSDLSDMLEMYAWEKECAARADEEDIGWFFADTQHSNSPIMCEALACAPGLLDATCALTPGERNLFYATVQADYEKAPWNFTQAVNAGLATLHNVPDDIKSNIADAAKSPAQDISRSYRDTLEAMNLKAVMFDARSRIQDELHTLIAQERITERQFHALSDKVDAFLGSEDKCTIESFADVAADLPDTAVDAWIQTCDESMSEFIATGGYEAFQSDRARNIANNIDMLLGYNIECRRELCEAIDNVASNNPELRDSEILSYAWDEASNLWAVRPDDIMRRYRDDCDKLDQLEERTDEDMSLSDEEYDNDEL